jgi:probable O-glycosylation ligase (exosortase A-associated)
MRDLFIAAIAIGAVPFVFYRAYIGVLMWTWLSLMVPHRIGWGFVIDFPIVQLIAIPTILATIIRVKQIRLPEKREIILLVIFSLFVVITTYFSYSTVLSYPRLIVIFKIFILFFAIVATIDTREKIHALTWIVVISILFYGVKGGVFAIQTGGNFIVFGPPGSYLGANNAVGVAIIAVSPLAGYLFLNTSIRWLAWLVLGAGLISVLSVLGSFSRGALLGLIVMVAYLSIRWSGRKGVALTLLFAVGIGAAAFMPSHWYGRMATISEFEEDASAQGRFDSWNFAYELALDRPLIGGGFDVFYHTKAREAYSPGKRFRSAHSIVFQILGEHGFVGLFLFFLLLFLAWKKAGKVRRRTRQSDQFKWAFDLSGMLQVSLVGYVAAGLFLDVAYFDLLYVILALIVTTSAVVSRELSEETNTVVGSSMTPDVATNALSSRD